MPRRKSSVQIAAFVRDFASRRDGATAVQFALLLVPLIFLVGFGIDMARAFSVRTSLQEAADAASLAMVRYAVEQMNAGKNPKNAQIIATGQAVFDSNVADLRIPSSVSATYTPTVTGNNISVRVGFSGTVGTTLTAVLGQTSIDVGGGATAVGNANPFVDVYLLIDQSGSMSIGATTNDINALISGTGCAFACHDSNNVFNVNGKMVDAYNYAVGKGIKLKFQEVNTGIVNFVNYVQSIDPGGQRVRVALYSFDNSIYTLQSLTGSVSKITSNLPGAPAAASETTAATHFNESISTLVNAIGASGDGKSQANSIKVFMLASDGVEDPGRFWTSQPQYRIQVAPFDMSFCSTLKGKGVTVGILDTGYLPMTWDWGYNATIGAPSLTGGAGTRRDDIQPLLKTCAGPYYVDGSDSSSIGTAFQSIFQAAVSPRITN